MKVRFLVKNAKWAIRSNMFVLTLEDYQEVCLSWVEMRKLAQEAGLDDISGLVGRAIEYDGSTYSLVMVQKPTPSLDIEDAALILSLMQGEPHTLKELSKVIGKLQEIVNA